MNTQENTTTDIFNTLKDDTGLILNYTIQVEWDDINYELLMDRYGEDEMDDIMNDFTNSLIYSSESNLNLDELRETLQNKLVDEYIPLMKETFKIPKNEIDWINKDNLNLDEDILNLIEHITDDYDMSRRYLESLYVTIFDGDDELYYSNL